MKSATSYRTYRPAPHTPAYRTHRHRPTTTPPPRPVTSIHSHRNEQSRPPTVCERSQTHHQHPGVRLTPATTTAEGNLMDTTPTTSSADPEFNAALEDVLERLAGVNAILADQ